MTKFLTVYYCITSYYYCKDFNHNLYKNNMIFINIYNSL